MRDAWTRTSRYHVSSIVRNSGDGMIHTIPMIGVRSRQKAYSYHGDSTVPPEACFNCKKRECINSANCFRFLPYPRYLAFYSKLKRMIDSGMSEQDLSELIGLSRKEVRKILIGIYPSKNQQKIIKKYMGENENEDQNN